MLITFSAATRYQLNGADQQLWTGVVSLVCHWRATHTRLIFAWNFSAVLTKGQIPLRYPASEPARELVRELVCDLLASRSQTCSELEFGLSRTI